MWSHGVPVHSKLETITRNHFLGILNCQVWTQKMIMGLIQKWRFLKNRKDKQKIRVKKHSLHSMEIFRVALSDAIPNEGMLVYIQSRSCPLPGKNPIRWVNRKPCSARTINCLMCGGKVTVILTSSRWSMGVALFPHCLSNC